jgi:hypothetical protein
MRNKTTKKQNDRMSMKRIAAKYQVIMSHGFNFAIDNISLAKDDRKMKKLFTQFF